MSPKSASGLIIIKRSLNPNLMPSLPHLPFHISLGGIVREPGECLELRQKKIRMVLIPKSLLVTLSRIILTKILTGEIPFIILVSQS